MATKAVKRKTNANTALMFNPSRGLSIGGRSSVKRTTARKSNPTPRTAAAKSNPRKRRRRRNPASTSVFRNPAGGALVGALLAGFAFSFADFGLGKVLPAATSTPIQIGTKVAAGFLIQTFGNKVPFLGKYKDGVAFLFFGLAASQFATYYLLPTVRNTFSQFSNQALQLISPTTTPATMAGYAQARQAYPVY